MSKHFIPGLLIGLAFGIIATCFFWYIGPMATYDKAINELGQSMIDNAQYLENTPCH